MNRIVNDEWVNIIMILRKQSILRLFIALLAFTSFPALAEQFDSLSYYEKFALAAQNYEVGRFRLAEKQFSSILIHDRDYRDPASQLMLAKTQYRQEKWAEAARSTKSIFLNFPGSPYQYFSLILMGDIALSQGKINQAYQKYLSVRPWISDSLYLAEIDQRIINCIAGGLKEEKVEGLLFKENNDINRSIINLSRGYLAWINGNNYDLTLALNGVDLNQLPMRFEFIFSKLRNISFTAQSEPITIAAILPLTGPNKELGYLYLLGLAEFLENDSSAHSMRFLIYDTEGNGAKALKIVKALQKNHLIAGILGPLTNEEVLSIAGINSTLPILVPKSSSLEISQIAPHLFFLSPSSKTIAQRTAQLMINELGFKNIAVLSPGEGKSKLMTDYFLEECYQLGVNPVAVEWYIENPDNISRQFQSIRRTAWKLLPEKDPHEDALSLVIDSLDALFDVDVGDFFELPEEEEKMDKKDSSKVILETINAIYIPIRIDELTYVGTQFPVYNLKTTLFGNQNWLDMEILNQELIGPHVQGMVIVSDVNSNLSEQFDNLFINYHALALDHATFLHSIVSIGNTTRRQLMDKLRNNDGFNGRYTSIRFKGKNWNENGSTMILEYMGQSVENIGVYYGNIFNTENE
ncbi:MAG: hypothetical protein CMG57_08980 [Candidatus Marinimicrobia bacterium]|nr:hypothetical protein [Candidatus Neomarinimicrobiota bacterium]